MALGRKRVAALRAHPTNAHWNVIEWLEELSWDLIEGMAKIALDPKNPIELRSRMFSDLAQYVAPKRRQSITRRMTERRISISWLPVHESPHKKQKPN